MVDFREELSLRKSNRNCASYNFEPHTSTKISMHTSCWHLVCVSVHAENLQAAIRPLTGVSIDYLSSVLNRRSSRGNLTHASPLAAILFQNKLMIFPEFEFPEKMFI